MSSQTPSTLPESASLSATGPTSSNPEASLSPLERSVLEEYARVNENLEKLTTLVSELATTPSTEILDSLRGLERKTSLVFTLLKASVYSIVLQQQIGEEEMVGDAE